MLNLLKCEFYKLRSSKGLYLIIAIMALQSLALHVLPNNLQEASGKEMLSGAFEVQLFLVLIPIMGAFSYFIVDEFTSGFTKNFIAYGHRRINIILSKSIAFYVGIVLISMAFPLSATVINTIKNGFGEPFTLSSLMFILRVLSLMIIIYIAIGSIIVLLAFISRNIIVTIAIFMCIDSINRLGAAFSMRNETVKLIYEKTVFHQPNIAILQNITFSQVTELLIISVGTILISSLLAIIIFNKADIK